MNFSRKVKEKAAEVFARVNVKILEITTEIPGTDGPRVISRARVVDPDALLVMIRRYEQRIEWAFKASVKREVEILTLRKKIAKLEMRLSKRKPIQTELFIVTDINLNTETKTITVEENTDLITEGAGTPFHGGIDEPGEEIHSGDQETSV